MKIIILTKEFPRSGENMTISDGSSYYFYNACKVLDKHGVKICVVCKSNHERGGVEQQGRILVYRLDPKRYFLEALRLIPCLGKRNTIILTDGPAYTTFFGLFAKILCLRHVAVFHDCRIKQYLSRLLAGHIDFGAFIGILLTYFSVLVNPYRIITVSEASKQELTKSGFKANKIFVTYNWISLDCISECQKQDLIVHIGLAPWKNLSMVIEAMPYVLTTVPTAQLYVIGGGSIKFYQEKVAKLGLVGKVHFYGLIPEKEKQSILMKAKVLTLVSSLEGFGIPVLEAWKHNVAPVVSRLPVFQEIAIDGKNCIIADFNPKKIASCIIALLQNDELRKRLCVNGKKALLSRFCLENASKKFINAIDSLVAPITYENS